MLNRERPPILLPEPIILSGREAFERYSSEAQSSVVPASFLGISKKFSLELFPELNPVDVTEIIFETRFETDKEAWLALRYAEAVAAIKSFEVETEYDFEGPITTPEDMDKLFLQIGIAVINEFADDTTEAVKQKVEDYFRDHPEAMLRLDFLKRQAEAGIIH